MTFDLYFVDGYDEKFNIDKILLSQYTNRGAINRLCKSERIDKLKLFIDSGAYTAFTKQISLDIDDYIEYINVNGHNFNIVASVDVIPTDKSDAIKCAEASFDNFIYMRHRITCPHKLLPTYHQGEPIENLKRIITYEDTFGKLDYIAIGALANTLSFDIRKEFISRCFDVIQEFNPNIKVHAFGMTDLRLLELFPFKSADSSAWLLAAGMGEIMTKFGRCAVSLSRPDRIRADSLQGNVLSDYVAQFGFTYRELSESRLARVKFNVRYLQWWEKNRVCVYKQENNKRRLF